MTNEENTGAYADWMAGRDTEGEQDTSAPIALPASNIVWVYEPHSNSARGHRVTNRRDDSLSFNAANRQSGLSAAKTLNGLEREADAAVMGDPEDSKIMGAVLLHGWLEGLRTTMLQARHGLDEIPVSASGQESDWRQVSEAVDGTLEEIDRLIGPVAPATGDTATTPAGMVSDAAPTS